MRPLNIRMSLSINYVNYFKVPNFTLNVIIFMFVIVMLDILFLYILVIVLHLYMF